MKDINKEIEMDSDTEIYLINKLEMEKLCRAKEPATISISDPRLQVGWVNFRSRGENDGNIEMVLAIYNKEKFQDSLTKQVELALQYTLSILDKQNNSTKLNEIREEAIRDFIDYMGLGDSETDMEMAEQYLNDLTTKEGKDV